MKMYILNSDLPVPFLVAFQNDGKLTPNLSHTSRKLEKCRRPNDSAREATSKGHQLAKLHHTPELPFTLNALFLNMITRVRQQQILKSKIKTKKIRKKLQENKREKNTLKIIIKFPGH